MSKKDFSVALKYVEARPRSQRRKGTEARVSGISVVGSGASATDLSLLQANLISVTNNFTALKDLFDSMFEKDSDGNIHAKLSLWSSGGITAGGVGSGGSGGGGISYNRLDSWADYSADKAGYVLSALLGKDLDNRVSALANAGYITQSALAPYALRSEIPSLVGYATQGWVGENYLSKSGGTINGSTTLSIGNLVVSSGDTVVGKIYPRTDNEYTLGQDTRKWKNILCYNINGSTPVNASNLKSTLGISDWALASVKPTYTASEVGALSVNGGHIYGSLYITKSSKQVYIAYEGASESLGYIGFNGKNSPIYIPSEANVIYSLIHSGNYSDYALPLTGGTLNGNLDFNANSANSTTIRYLRMWYSSGGSVYRGMMRVNDTNLALSHYSPTSGVMYELQIGKDGLNFNDVGVVKKLLHSGNYADYITNSYIKSTLGISDWALASVKPTYTASEVGALSVNGGDIGGSLNFRNGSSITCANGIVLEMYAGVDTYLRGSSNIYISAPNVYTQRNVYTYKVLDSGNYSGYALSVNGGTVNGSITAPSFILAPADTSDVSILFRSGTLSDSAYDYKIGKFTDANGKKAFGMAMAKPNGSWVKFLGISTDSEYNVSKIDLLTNVEVNGTLKTTGALTAASITANSLTIGGVTITYDSVNEALCINGNMYALGGITAGGAGISAYSSLEARVARLEQQLNIS